MKAFKAFFRLVVASTTVKGVEVSLYASSAILFVVLFTFGKMTMPGTPIWAPALFAILSVAGIAVHECGHWLAAHLNGVKATYIRFKWFGAATGHEAITSRKALVWMAAAGIIGNAAVAAALYGLSLLVPGSALAAALVGGAGFNVMVGAFNAIPALPMDGGILMAALLAPNRRLAVGWQRVRYLNIALMGVFMVLALQRLDHMMALYAGCVLLHMWIAGEEPDADFAEA